MESSFLLSSPRPELALQRIEAQTGIILSRQIGTPNIRAKGNLHPREVLVPADLYPLDHPLHGKAGEGANVRKAKLIEEVDEGKVPVTVEENSEQLPRPEFAWGTTADGASLITFKVPKLVRPLRSLALRVRIADGSRPTLRLCLRARLCLIAPRNVR